MATEQVCRTLKSMGGRPTVRAGFVTDNQNHIVDVTGLDLSEPESVETALNQIPGVVTNGLFSLRPADVLILGKETGIEIL
jgi:ribose 5-phosphate isomerase A